MANPVYPFAPSYHLLPRNANKTALRRQLTRDAHRPMNVSRKNAAPHPLLPSPNPSCPNPCIICSVPFARSPRCVAELLKPGNPAHLVSSLDGPLPAHSGSEFFFYAFHSPVCGKVSKSMFFDCIYSTYYIIDPHILLIVSKNSAQVGHSDSGL